MNSTMDTLKSYEHLSKASLQTAVDNAVLAGVASATAAITMLGLFSKVHHKRHHKRHSADFHHALKGYHERLDKMQEQLDQAIEKWGNINNQPNHHNISNTTMSP